MRLGLVNHLLASLRVRLFDEPLKIIEDEKCKTHCREQKIPNTVIQTFEKPLLGRRHFKEHTQFKLKNKDLNFQFFDRRQRDDWMRNNYNGTIILKIYEAVTYGPSKADIFRYCIIYKNGGYYFDISKGVDTAITSLHPEDSAGFITYEANSLLYPSCENFRKWSLFPDHYIAQWGFGFVKEHPLLAAVIQNIEKDAESYIGFEFTKPKDGVLLLTATAQFTRTVREYIHSTQDASLYQAGMDFHGHGIFNMKGSNARYKIAPAYARARNDRILNDDLKSIYNKKPISCGRA